MGEPAKTMLVTLTVDDLREMIRSEVANAINGVPVEPPSRYMDSRQVAAHYKVSPATVSNWVAAGCPHIRRSKRMVRFELAEVEAWWRGRSSAGLALVK